MHAQISNEQRTRSERTAAYYDSGGPSSAIPPELLERLNIKLGRDNGGRKQRLAGTESALLPGDTPLFMEQAPTLLTSCPSEHSHQPTANPTVPEAPRPGQASRGVTDGQPAPLQEPEVANRRNPQQTAPLVTTSTLKPHATNTRTAHGSTSPAEPLSGPHYPFTSVQPKTVHGKQLPPELLSGPPTRRRRFWSAESILLESTCCRRVRSPPLDM